MAITVISWRPTKFASALEALKWKLLTSARPEKKKEKQGESWEKRQEKEPKRLPTKDLLASRRIRQPHTHMCNNCNGLRVGAMHNLLSKFRLSIGMLAMVYWLNFPTIPFILYSHRLALKIKTPSSLTRFMALNEERAGYICETFAARCTRVATETVRASLIRILRLPCSQASIFQFRSRRIPYSGPGLSSEQISLQPETTYPQTFLEIWNYLGRRPKVCYEK